MCHPWFSNHRLRRLQADNFFSVIRNHHPQLIHTVLNLTDTLTVLFVLRIVSLWNADAVTLKRDTRLRELWSERGPALDRWHWFAMKARFHWDDAAQPYLQIWRAVGDEPPMLIASRQGPNAFNDRAPFLPQKFGLYRWDPWTGAPTRTLYSKGFYVLRDLPGATPLDEHAMIALLRSI